MNIVELSGGVGGARLARGLMLHEDIDLTVVVNVGDDDEIHGLHVSPDLDTVVYTLAEVEGAQGWGRKGETFVTNDELARFGVDNRFALGDLDLALNLYRTARLRSGETLSEITADVAKAFDLSARVIPVTDDWLATEVLVDSGWISFQEYFVIRGHRDEVRELRFAGADQAVPAPGVITAIEEAEQVVIGPSNPPLSIWPILSVAPLRRALETHLNVTVVSPLIGGSTVKGPAARVMASLGLPAGNDGVIEAYRGLANRMIVHHDDADQGTIEGVELVPADTLIKEPDSARRLAAILVRP